MSTDTCEECGRPFAKDREEWLEDTILATCGKRVAPHGPMAYEECAEVTIRRLKAQVRHLEGELENYDTTDAQNHAVCEVVKKLNRILDERQQVGTFGSPQLQLFAERILELQRGYLERK
jgi:uncharacterized coiled-coil protein SlyX